MMAVLIGADVRSGDDFVRNLRLRWPNLGVLRVEGERDFHQLEDAAAHLVVVDAKVPGAVALVSRIRRSSDAVLLVVASEPDEGEQVDMLEAGADDYLALSTSAPVLVARISAALRRAQELEERPEPALECGQLRVNPLTHEAWVNGQVIHLTPTEFRLLCHLVKSKGRLVTHEALRASLWGSEGKYYADSLRKYVQRVRQKMAECGNGQLRIETIPRTGYRLLQTLREDT